MEINEAIMKRRSVRKYQERPVDEEALKQIMKAVSYAPSAKNIQPYIFILVRDPDMKAKLAHAAFGAKWIAEAPIVVVLLGNVEDAYGTMGGYQSSVFIDAAIALDHLTLAATAEGLATCWIGAFSEEKVVDAMGIDDNDYRVVALTPLGYPAEEPGPRPRKGISQLFRNERL
ncbi:MAG: nitroreductase family protein [Candidatus Thermoplasmatota archaeon]|nr:nitroreductase family protein [Candidatus Thermoplasmatota archaeon]